MSGVGRVVRLARARLAQEEQAIRHMFDPLNQPSLDSDDVAGNMQTDPMMIAP